MGHDINLYWPVQWLPADPDVQQTRIFTFGYNADFRSSTQSVNLGISDFSKTLLYDMVYGRGQTGENFDLGRVSLGSILGIKPQVNNDTRSVQLCLSPILWVG